MPEKSLREMTDTGAPVALRGLARIVGFLVCVELASGVLQGFYTPIYTDIARHLSIRDASVNWFEAAQLVVSALVVPVLARLGDLVGHRRVLVGSTAVTAAATWAVAFSPTFATFMLSWAVQGVYVVWLPMEISIIHRRTSSTGDQAGLTRRAAAFLVAALEGGVILGAVASGVLVGTMPIALVLCVPAIAVTAVLVVIWFGIPATPPVGQGSLDWRGLGLLVLALGLVMGGLIALRLEGPGSLVPWCLMVLGLLVLVPFAKVELRLDEPLIDVRLLRSSAQWPVQLTAFLFGMSVLGAQIPLSTFARTNPRSAGYGLGASAGFVSLLIAMYVVALVVGALSLPAVARHWDTRPAMLLATLLVALGYGLFLPFHASTGEALANMAVAGIGSGALVAALPAAAAAAAPADRTGLVTGLTNTTKTIGGAIASSIFAIALSSTGSIASARAGHASLSGYLTVWSVCAITALVAAASLLVVPRAAFGEPVRATA